MKKTKLTFLFSLTVLAMSTVSCKDGNLYDPNAERPEEQEPEKLAYTFDFSTVQKVDLSVDYSAFQTYGPVFFSVYNENPFVEDGDEQYLNEDIKPIYENFTDKTGKFHSPIQLPAYAENLYVVTGNYFVTDRLIEVNVENGIAKAVATKPSWATTRAITRANPETGVQTREVMPNLWKIVDANGNSTDEEIYNEWLTPLGTWNSATGVPSYIIKPGEVRDELLCTAEEIEGLYSAVSSALNVNQACNADYRNQADLTLDKESEVVLTVLGGSTCWNCSLGYYYYDENNVPTSPKDLHIIMLFPNTQDGEWANFKPSSKHDYNNNIGIHRGDAVQLKYYPHIAEGNMDEETTKFPMGTKIGFILKAHGWGMQGPDYWIKNFRDSNRKYNVWGTTTDGCSFCRPSGGANDGFKFTNDNGESRSAKFAYNAPNGDKYAIVTFEDACNDQDYDDVIFALKPVNSFTPLPEIKEKKTTTVGVYAFEDLWPSKGDYDLNDAVVDFKHEKIMSKQDNEEEYKLYQENFLLTTYQNYVTLKSGLALILNTPVTPSSITMKRIAPNSEEEEEVEFKVEGNVYYLTDNIKAELGTTYKLELTYTTGQSTTQTLASVKPFIYRDEEEGSKTWEVHIPLEAPTTKMNRTYFGKEDDASKPEQDLYFVRKVNTDNYPFAFFLYGVTVEYFLDTILERDNESVKISDLYQEFLPWSASFGSKNKDWYLHKSPRPQAPSN